MALIQDIKNFSIILTANLFNPSIFNQYWLVKNKFVEEKDLINSIFLPGLSQIKTPSYEFDIVQDRLQFQMSDCKNEDFDLKINNLIIPILNKMPEVPYVSLGINFEWWVFDDRYTLNEFSKKYFYIENSNLYSNFDTNNNSMFGSYMSKNFLSSRLKLEIKPTQFLTPQGVKTNELFNFDFNFHFPLENNKLETIILNLSNWQEYFYESKKIVNSLWEQ